MNWLLPLSTRQCASRSRSAVLSRSPCFHRSLKIRASPHVKNEHRRVNSIFSGCRSPAGSPLCCAALLLLQGSFQCMEPDGEQRTQRGLGTAMYCSARSSAMHTHSLPFLLCLWQSLNLLLYLSTLSGQWLYHLSSLISSLQIRYVLFLPASLNTLKVDCNRYFPCCLLYCSFKLPYPLFLTCT